jgi:hypothetical protein
VWRRNQVNNKHFCPSTKPMRTEYYFTVPLLVKDEECFFLSASASNVNRMTLMSFHAASRGRNTFLLFHHAASVDSSAQCPAVVILSVKTPLISLSSPYVMLQPGCYALERSSSTDGSAWCLMIVYNTSQTVFLGKV